MQRVKNYSNICTLAGA